MKNHLEQSQGTVRGLFWSTRPWQWYKQSLVLLPIIFSGHLFDSSAQQRTLFALVAFCLAAGSVYVFNDISDIEEDRRHPRKRHRPIASGQVGVPAAIGFGIALVTSGLLLAAEINLLVVGVLVLYLSQNVLYNAVLKGIVYADVLSIAVGFVLRALAGVYAIMPFTGFPSSWLIVCTFLTALTLAIGKRRRELSQVSDGETRSSLAEYNQEALDYALIISTSSLLMSYTMYTVFGASKPMMLTLPFALFATFRYHHLLSEGDGADQVEWHLFTDRAFVANLVVWLGIIITVIYLLPAALPIRLP